MAGENAARKPEPVQAAPAPVEKPARPKEVVIDLGTPVQAHGEMLSKITFRRPTGKDIMAIGDDYPIHIDWATGQVRPNPPAMGQMMSLLAAVPPSTIQSMDAEDWSTCAHALMGFFPPGAQAMQF
ncbi:hypothetical protein ABID65_007672 [Bradyrhizobium sp. S3.9.2]|uniref:phage tail assembly protein n=1 Tax=unclassified Bradyrhizobium TaxID=2631580 RepID=UPI00339B1148